MIIVKSSLVFRSTHCLIVITLLDRWCNASVSLSSLQTINSSDKRFLMHGYRDAETDQFRYSLMRCQSIQWNLNGKQTKVQTEKKNNKNYIRICTFHASHRHSHMAIRARMRELLNKQYDRGDKKEAMQCDQTKHTNETKIASDDDCLIGLRSSSKNLNNWGNGEMRNKTTLNHERVNKSTYGLNSMNIYFRF